MGTRHWALPWALWVLLLVPKADTQQEAQPSWAGSQASVDPQRMDFAQQLNFVPPAILFPTISSPNPAHNGRVCSTWGDFHYKTFDGAVFRFPGLCNYVLSAHCGGAYEDFNVQMRRGMANARPTITRVVLRSQGLVLEASNGSVLVDGQRVKLPFARAGLLVEKSGSYIKVSVRLVLTFMWNGGDSALLELDPKYINQTCGLCGDFNGLPAASEFYAHNARLTPLQFGNLQKMDGPTEQCQDPLPSAADNCTDEEDVCHRTLLGAAFSPCHALVDPEAYVAACTQDLCRCPTCPCATFAEYSRQCAHAGGQPQNWRRPDLCPATCPLGMQHLECGSPCANTCSNPERAQLCEDHCVDGCFCPDGTVWDDVGQTGCVPLEQCSCTHGGRTYAPGASFTSSCSSCTCSGGRWQCQDLPCPGTCSVQGGAHVSTYDEKLYDLHGDCSYVLSKQCADSSFTVLAELRKCGLTDTENCLKAVTLSLDGGDTTIRIQSSGGVFMNSIYTQLPVSAANITIFKPTSFFIMLNTALGLQVQVQLVPLMQVFLQLLPEHRGQMCGLCGNFNQNQADDFRALSGVVEGTAAAFANTWKTQASCPNVRNSFEDPCSLSVENENYAQHWCSLLTHPASVFAACHGVVNPTPFHSNCMFDTCNCEKSEDCMCAALSSYVRACAAKGVLLDGWRDGVCTKYMSNCPKSQRYAYMVDSCQPTCRALSQADVTCTVDFVPVDGCTCPPGTFLDDAGACVPAEACPCYFRGSVVAPGEVVHDNGIVCSCSNGKLSCLGASEQKSRGCVAPMVYLDCNNASAGTPGAECLRSCHTLDVDCFSTHCVSGCVCPLGLVSDGNGGCVAEEDCPCLHNDATYRPGDTIRVDCNTCTCKNRRWECSRQPCLGTCVAYGDGHFITFDGERYSFDGSCEYTLAQDHCGSSTTNGTFRVVTENVPCGTTGVTCSKAIKIFLESYELILHEGTHKVVQRGPGEELPYKIRLMGIYLVVETRHGLVVSWDRRTSVFIRLRQDYKGRVCGLCGNFDDKAINDFTTRGQSVVGNALEFGNSWKFSPSCPDAPVPRDPCTANPYRKSWAQKQCSLINSATFAACHPQVDPSKYYEACVSDACACDSGGDCECFCTAVAAYAQACRDVGVCVSWRSPDICPLFCDYYNPHGECEWHYEPCGAPCLKTCRNPSGRCLMDLPGLEGCYPKCPPSKPFFSEEAMSCVARCGCYDEQDNYYEIGTSIPTAENCQHCNCTTAGVQCTHSPEACTCTYEGRTYGYKEVIYNTTDGLGGCLLAVCGDNGTITRTAVDCPGTPATTPFTFTTTEAPVPTTGWAPTVSTVCVRQRCQWSSWYDSSRPLPGLGGGDFETFEGLRQKGYPVCAQPVEVECRAQQLPSLALAELGQMVECSLARGLVCLNSEQSPPLCHNYEMRVLCCDYVPCATTPAPATPRPIQSSTTPVPPPASQPTPTGATSTFRSTAASPSQAPSSGAPEATSCQPRCQWTEWFDTDYPQSEEAGGDMETYDRIRNAGGDVCAQPQDIECRAENFPYQTPEELGQRVHCDVNFGLECRNQEQPGLFKMCYNYRVRVLCCSYSHCGLPMTTANVGTSTKVNGATSQGPSTANSTTRVSTMANTATTISAMPTTKLPATEPGTMPGTTLGSTTAPSSLPAGATSLLPSLPSRTSTSTVGSPTSAPGTTTPSVPGQATSVHPSHTTTQKVTEASSQEPTPVLVTVQRFTTRPATGAQVGKTSTVPPGSPTPYLRETSTGRREMVPVTAEATTSTGTTGCQPRCEWTEWLDVDFPTSGVMGGDIETFENIRAAGGRLCEQPQKIECRAENYPEVSIDQIGQVLTCSLQTGLICRNRDQKGPFNMCFNYNIRVLCCDDYRHCPSTAQPAHTRTTTQPKLSTTPTADEQASKSTPGLQATTTWGASPRNDKTASVVTPHRQTTSRAPGTRSPSTTTLPARPSQPSSTTPTQATSPSQGCEPQCAWTDWFDEDYPTPGPNGGDFETLAVLRAAGHIFCEQPEDIECRSELEPQVALEQLDQVVMCNVSVGLVCRNREQPQPLGYCHNYHVRLLCCDYSRCASSAATTATRATTPATTRTPVVPITGATSPGQSLSPEASPGTTLPPPSTETGTAPNTAKVGLSTRSLPPSPTPKATDSPGSTSSGPSTSASTASGTPGLIQTTPLLTSAPPAVSVTPGSGTTACQPRCSWSDWLNESNPVPGATGGDFETYASLRAAGHVLCEQPVALECRAVALPDVPLSELGQVVQCRLQDGLVCRNRDQVGRFKMCLDYQVRVLCCDYSHCPSTPATTAIVGPSTRPHSPLPTSTSTLSVMVPSTGPAGTTSGCQPACRWTDWLDSDQPLPGRYGGDIETYYHIESVHGQLCAEPVAIECEAVLFPGVDLQQLGQVVQCDVHYGLICRNSWQVWGRNCLNYHVRVQCCDDYSHCASSPAPTATTSGTSTGQPTSEGPHTGTPGTIQTRPSSPVATASATLSTTQTRVSSPGATPSATKSTTGTGPSSPGATPSATKSTTERGASSPGATLSVTKSTTEMGSSSPGATPSVTKSTTGTGASSPGATPSATKSTTETVASSPGATLSVTKSTTERGASSSGATPSATKATTHEGPSSPGATPNSSKSTTEMEPSSTGPTQSATESTTQTGVSSPRTTEKVSVPGPSSSPTVPSISTRPASSLASKTVPVATTYIQTSSSTRVTVTPSATTLPVRPSQPSSTPTQATSPSQGCEPECTWTDWFDEDYPRPGPNGGDFETLAVLRAAGHVFCEQPEDIECRSELEPQVALEQLDQVVTCNVSVGLVCRNHEQPQPFSYCHNYHVRLLCCDYSRCASSAATTATRATTPATTRTPVVPITGATSPGQSLSPEASPGTTLPPPSTETGTAPNTAKVGLSTRSLPPSPTPKATDSPGSTSSGPSTSASTASGTLGLIQTTPLLTSAPPAASVTPGSGTTACQPRCSWSDWLNESNPVPGATGGDFETYASLRAAGHVLCEQPVALECRAVALPDVPLSELGQVVQCRLQDGLVCRNRDQVGRFKMCLDYQVRVLCCDYSHCPSTPATTAIVGPSTRPHSPLPTSTSTLSVMVPSTGPAGTTSGCQPACRWTDWLDSDQPLPGRYGGDIETYYHIESVHGQLCAEPVAIECEAVLFPGVDLQQLGQVVQCDVHYGLICRNSWQVWGRNCLNYHVRVQCCDDYSHCASSPAPTATTSGTSTGQPTSEGPHTGTPGTIQTRPSSPVATASATLSTTQTRVSSPGATPSATKSTTGTGPSSPGATPSATKSTTGTGPSSPGATPSATKSTTERGASSPGATPSVTKSTTGTGASSPGATPSATKSTTETVASSPGATLSVTKSTTERGASSSGATPSATKATTHEEPSSPGATPSATKTTTKTGPSSPGATPGATKSSTETRPFSPWVMPSGTTSTTKTGHSSPGPTPSSTKSTTKTGPSSPGATPSATKTTTEKGHSSPGITPSATKSTTEMGLSSPGAIPSTTKSTTEMGPSSPMPTPSATKAITETAPSSPRVTTSATKSTTYEGPSSPGATPSATKSTTETGPSSPGATPSATKSTTETGPSSPGATPSATKSTTETGPSSPGATPSATKSTTETGPSSPGATPSATKSTTETGPSSPGATPSATKSTTETGPSSPGATPSATKSTTETGPSSPGATPSASKSTTETGLSSPGATPSANKATTEIGPSSPRVTPSAIKSTTKTVSFSHGVTTSTTFSATETEASTPKATPWITMSNTEAGSSSPGPTTSATKSSTLTGPSSPRATPSITESTTQTGASSPRTTERVSVPGPSLSSTIPSVSTRPASSLTSTTAPVVTAHIQTTSRFPGTRSPSTSTLPARPSQPSSTTSPEATSPSQGCEPQCTWTDWFDEDYPTPGPNGGDFETLAVLRAAGHIFCEQPEDIECRSELEPQVALEQLDQVVMCNVSVGLVCRNREQPQPRPYCHNYHVRLLCCDYSRCASSAATTATRATTPATTRMPVVPTTRATSPGQPDMSLSTAHPTAFSLEPTTSPSSLAPTSHCFCQAFGQLFLPGDVVYNKTDRAGCRFYAICNQHCAIDRFQDDCPSPSPPTPSVSTPLPSPAPGCDLVDPPRQVNESWTLEDCTVARCEGHNHIVLLEPTPVAPVTCVNGLPPVKVGHEDEPCDYHYECECSCSGWGNSHYSTFDGTSYSFSDNCTYVLVREIRPQIRNLSVLLDNSFCEASPPAARCPRALRVQYQSTEVILSTTTSPSGQRESLILFDQMRVTQSFSKNGVQVSATVATAMSLVIPVIGISITFDGQAFQIQLPYGLFHHNTEGQCGTCTNSQADDCRRPDGTMAPSCRDMASSWLFPESNKEGCWAPPSPPPTASPSPAPTMSTSTPCPPAPLCELLLSEVFAECRDLIPPEPFLSACLSDGCQTSHPATPCQSLEAYAALCRGRGVCSDWRNATGGLCDLTCPPGKVYEPCGPAQPPTCDSRAQSPVSTALAEGCFCPDGQTLFNAYTDVCVPQCPCVGPDGYPKFPGERWVSNCQECECAGSPVSVRCTPLPCPAQDLPPECGLAGFVAVTRPRADNPCCSETLCVCNITTCPQNPRECGPQEELIPTQEGGNCCPTFTCRPKLCEYNGTVYGVGATFPAVTPCHTCTCLSTGTQEPTIHCEKDSCMTTCPQGFHYTTIAGQCCGECLQSTCFTPDGGLIQPNETWANSLDNCTEYHCEAENGRFLLMLRPTACPDVSSCRGVLRKSGCCYTCEEDVKGSCHVHTNMTVLQHGDCVTEVAVNVPFCEGSCPGMSRYSPNAQTMQHHCTCCRELRTHQRTVTLHCPDSTTIQHSYTYVDACDCEEACVPEAAPDRPQQLSSS